MTLFFPRRLFRRLLPAAIAGVLPLAAHAARVDDGSNTAATRCNYVDVADLPIHYVGPGLQPAVDGSINGSPAIMLVDTGAFDTTLTMNSAIRRDLNVSATGRYAQGVGGRARLYVTRLKEFSIGPTRSANRTELYVTGEDNLTPVFDAIAGAPFLLQMDLELDLRDKQMHLRRAHDCGGTPLLLWKEDTQAIPFLGRFDRSPNPHFTVTIDGKDVDAVIDSGAHHTALTLDAARRLGIDLNGPGVRRLGTIGGIGTERAPLWSLHTKSIEVGAEAIANADIGIIDSQGSTNTELYLGQDFLRAHRVLFAMSQNKLYFAYLGGEVFSRSDGMPDWIRAEAESGNPDAGYALAVAYADGNGVARDRTQANAWLRKAAAAGQPNASLALGRELLLAGQVADAIPKLRSALDQLPANRLGPLWLYVARVRNGEADLARTELKASLGKQKDDGWPRPIAAFYLGELDAAHLLEEAGKDPALAHARTCMADAYMAEWHRAHGQQAQADALTAARKAQCAPSAASAATNKAAP
jgi:predicted aspartyl protease